MASARPQEEIMQRPRKPSNLSESLHQRLNSYALAAGAAGVSLLALAQTSEAKIVYTKASINISPGGRLNLDLNHDHRGDFTFSNTTSTYRGTTGKFDSGDNLKIKARRANGVMSQAAVLHAGVQIGPKKKFQGKTLFMAGFARTCTRTETTNCNSWTSGNWKNITKGYLGLKFLISGKAHYGWARLNVTVGHRVYATLTGYAYETIPNKSIIAGKTHGKDVVTVTEPASLGALVAGANGVRTWRQK
jgi:hypothetical protein